MKDFGTPHAVKTHAADSVRWRFVFFLALLAGGALAVEPPVAAGYRGPSRDGVYPETGLLREWPTNGIAPVWKYGGLGEGYSSVAVADGVVYGIGKHYENGQKIGRLKAVSLDSGKELWDMNYGAEFGAGTFEGPRSSVEVRGGRVYFASGKAVIHCRDAKDGRAVWEVDIEKAFGGKPHGWGYIETPLLVNDLVVFSPCPTSNDVPPVVAVDQGTGATRWKARTGYAGYTHGGTSAIAFQTGGKTVIVHQLDKRLVALDAADGAELWSVDAIVPGNYYLTPIYHNGHLLCWTKGLSLLKITDGAKSFEKRWDGVSVENKGQMVVLDGRVYAFSNVNHAGKNRLAWTAIALDSGTVVKTEPCMDEGAVASAEGLLYWLEGGRASAKTPRLSLVKGTADGFQVLGQFNVAPGRKELWTPPTIAAGMLLVRHGSHLAAYDIKSR